MTELLPCPFCGGEAHTIEPARYGKSWGVRCECGAFLGFEYTETEAIAAWNTRTECVDERETINKTGDFVTHGSGAERTCKSTTDDSAWCFVCSECGKSFPRNKLHLAHNHGEINYCPNCGARVVSA